MHSNRIVTVHSVISNTLRDAQKCCLQHFAPTTLGIFRHKCLKTPRGIVGE